MQLANESAFFQALEQLGAAVSMKDALWRLEMAIVGLGFTKFALVDWEGDSGVRAVYHNAPGAWSDPRDDFERSPLVHRMMASPLPFAWNRDLFIAEEADGLWQQQAAHGFRSGLCAPYGAQDKRACILVTGHARELAPLDDYNPVFGLMLLVAAACHQALLRHAEPQATAKPVRLRPRELECLHWALMEKTAWETAVILGISERTVVQHLNRAREQLDAPNKKVAASRAVQLALLPLSRAA